MASKGLTYDGEKYRWTKSFPDLQSFVTASLNITGKWTSPGGDAKLFKSDGDGEFVIKWYGPRSKRLAIQSDNAEQYLKLKFESSVIGVRPALTLCMKLVATFLALWCLRPVAVLTSRSFLNLLV